MDRFTAAGTLFITTQGGSKGLGDEFQSMHDGCPGRSVSTWIRGPSRHLGSSASEFVCQAANSAYHYFANNRRMVAIQAMNLWLLLSVCADLSCGFRFYSGLHLSCGFCFQPIQYLDVASASSAPELWFLRPVWPVPGLWLPVPV